MAGMIGQLKRVLDLLDRWIEHCIVQEYDLQLLIITVEVFPKPYDLYEQIIWEDDYSDIRVKQQKEAVWQEVFD